MFRSSGHLIVLLLLFSVTINPLDGKNEGINRYLQLHGLYIKWNEGLFGSRNFYKRKLQRLLDSYIGKSIKTGYDFYISMKGGQRAVFLKSSTSGTSWLQIRGSFNKENLKAVMKGRDYLHRRWWRSGYRVAVQGILSRYWLSRDPGGRIIIVKLKNMMLVPDPGSGKNAGKKSKVR